MIRVPKVAGLTLCHHIEVDPQSGQYSLMGIFHSRYFRSFPSPMIGFTVYAALYGGEGEGTIELTVSQAQTEREIYRLRKWVSFADRRLINMELKVNRCVFPEAGRYLLGLRFDEQTVTSRIMNALLD
jgi:hypothetical protein